MKKLLFCLLALFAVDMAMAQDLIRKVDNTTIEATVLEISPDQIAYKRFSNPTGPTYRIPTSEVESIRYPNGDVDTFTPVKPATPAPEPEPTPEPQARPATVRLNYMVGDYYDVDGVQGVVIAIEPGGEHGLILSLQQVTSKWDLLPKEAPRCVGADSEKDGRENMAAVERYIAENGLSWEDFPAFKWCRDLGEGWYLPAIDEWLTIAFNFNGGNRSSFNREARNRVNNQLREHGGKRLDKMLYYFSSTEQDEVMALTGHMAIEPPYVLPLKKNGITYLVRAVHRF